MSAKRGALDLDIDQTWMMDGILGLLGPSGSGKTSLLRIISGLDSADGSLSFNGQRWLDGDKGVCVPCHRRPVGIVFQDGRLFPHHTVRGNLHYATKRTRRQIAGLNLEAVSDALGLNALLDRWPAGLSGGERQRVALARSLLTAPSLLLMDEPLSALDRKTKAELLPYLSSVPRMFGVPVLFVSHAIEEVAQLSNQVVLLSQGKVAAQGPVPGIFQQKALHDFTGAFDAGAILHTAILRHDLDWHITYVACDGQTMAIPLVRSLDIGDAINLRVRARDVTLATGEPKTLSTQNQLHGIVTEIEEESSTAFCEVTIRLTDQYLRARVMRKAVHDLAITPGQSVTALIKGTSFDRRALL